MSGLSPFSPRSIAVRILAGLWLSAATLLSFPDQPNASAAERPNIVFVMTDDQGYWDTGATGNPHIDTPHMDRLASEGARLNRYYAAPVCAPTRAGVMTGRYYLRTGLYNTRFGGDSLGRNEVTVAQLLKRAGYRTGLFGKWHLGKYHAYQPQERGFDEFFGHYHGHIERYQFPDQVYHNGQPVEARGYVSDVFTDAAIDFVEHAVKTKRDPFFCALMYNAPHSPFLLDTSHYNQPQGDLLLTKYLQRGLPIREARIYALIERVDQNLGRLLKAIDEVGAEKNTVVVFTSDNGGVSKYWKGGMNGNKAGVYEGGVRAPCFVRWPNRIEAGKSIDAQTSHVDWLPTFCEIAETEIPDDRVMDGISLVPLLTTDSDDSAHRYVYHTWDRYTPNADQRWAVSDQRWKLLCQVGRDSAASRTNWRLFDLQADPGETRNIARQHPQEVERLREAFLQWFEDVTQGQVYRPVPVPVGHPEENPVEIEPSWSTQHGDHIAYTFDGYDWDTIDRWRDPGERAVWRLDVQRPGDYRVKLTYGCRPLDAGGVVRLSVGDASVTHQVRATATADQFESADVGAIHLESGASELVAEVVSCPGTELMRLNGISLERLPD
ncbi:arylsulfatase [Roseiconus nitratireducens]|uniref:Arylsulfatase n=1 Tax=Roseiconus nitratireducens TaxID=2605748 RepID=A0A5M6DLA1_9BACT|nr:arylsulfatase [Roseiconus nitratireducens]KAA5547032.1 arylsulfatase [Roseiconus nitratireducens]